MEKNIKNKVDLSIIIVNYNNFKLFDGCIKSIIDSEFINLTIEVIVVDNASEEDEIKKVINLVNSCKVNLNIKLILNKENLGYSKANNIGFKESVGRYILFLNSDTLLLKDSLQKSISFINKNKCAVHTGKLILENGILDLACHRGFPTIWASLCYFLKIDRIFVKSKLFGKYHLTYLNLNQVHEIDSPSGAYYFIDRKVFEEAGQFDEDYFMYGEDLDLSYKVKELGYKILFDPNNTIIHKKRQSGISNINKKISLKTKIHFYNAMKIFYIKHYKNKYFYLVNLIVIFILNIKLNLLTNKYENWN